MRTILFKIVLPIICLFIVNIADAASIVAVVNKKAITDYDIQQKTYIFIFLSNRTMPNPEEIKVISKQFIDSAINDEIKMQIVAEYNDRLKDTQEPKIQVTDQELENVINSIAKRHKAKDKQGLYLLLGKYQINPLIFEEALRTELLWSELVRRAVIPTIRVFDSEVNHCIKTRKIKEGINPKEFCQGTLMEEKLDLEIRKIIHTRRHLAFLEVLTK